MRPQHFCGTRGTASRILTRMSTNKVKKHMFTHFFSVRLFFFHTNFHPPQIYRTNQLVIFYRNKWSIESAEQSLRMNMIEIWSIVLQMSPRKPPRWYDIQQEQQFSRSKYTLGFLEKRHKLVWNTWSTWCKKEGQWYKRRMHI
jgi:hypothetical protein